MINTDDNQEKTRDFEVYDMNCGSVHVRVDCYSCKTASTDGLSEYGLAISIESPDQPTEISVKTQCKNITLIVNHYGQAEAPRCSLTTPKPSVEDESRDERASRKRVKDRILGLMGKIPFATQIVSNSATIWEFVSKHLGG